MPGNVALRSQSGTPAETWGTHLETFLHDAGSSDAGTRKAAELRLAIFPHAKILTHLPRIWRRELRRRERVTRILSVIAVLIALTFIPINLFLMFLKQQQEFNTAKVTLNLIGLMVMVFAQTGFVAFLAFKAFGDRALSGTVYTLVQHQCIELVPLLIEALPVSRPISGGGDSQRSQVMAALTRLLPRFAIADRKALPQRQRDILTRELRQFNRTLQNPLAALTPEEANFLSAVLSFLSTEYGPYKESKSLSPVTTIVEDLAVERAEYHQEPAARTLVREAARIALVRLSTS